MSGRERVTGIGGLFFRARDPESLGRWYTEHLGIAPPPPCYDEPSWWQEPGPTVWSPFPADTDQFGGPDQAWMVTFRVNDLDAMIAQLRGAGIEVDVNPVEYPNGRFARTADPEGNTIQLWQAAGRDAQGP